MPAVKAFDFTAEGCLPCRKELISQQEISSDRRRKTPPPPEGCGKAEQSRSARPVRGCRVGVGPVEAPVLLLLLRGEERSSPAHFGNRGSSCTMVKIGVQQPAAGLKPEKAEAPPLVPSHGIKAEIALPLEAELQALPMQNRRSLSHIFYLTMILMLLLLGLILTSMYMYRYFSVADSITGLDMIDEDDVPWECQTIYADYYSTSLLGEQLKLREDVRINLEEHYEWISVPLPHLDESDPAAIIHDFQRGLTAYHDLLLDKCYVIELNTTNVLPPQDFQELLTNIKNGGFLPQTYIVEEEMIVMEPVNDTYQLGSSIYLLCHGKETYWLKRRTARRYIHRRAARKCHHIHHFANTFVVDTAICQRL